MRFFIFFISLFVFLHKGIAQSHPISFTILANRLPGMIDEMKQIKSGDERSFMLNFDTLSIYFSDDELPRTLVSQVIVTYDSRGRVEEATIKNKGIADYYVYYYHYLGNQSRFSSLDYYLFQDDQKVFKGVQRHLYNSQNRLISSIEFDANQNIIYGDSLAIEYDGLERIRHYEYLYFQEGKWNIGKRVFDIEYDQNKIFQFSSSEWEDDSSGKTILNDYIFENVAFLNDDYSILFPDFNEWFEMDSLGTDNYFFSREDAAQKYVKQPIDFQKFKRKSNGNKGEMVLSAFSKSSDDISSTISDSSGQTLYSIEYKWDDKNRLSRIIQASGLTQATSLFEYNDLGRISYYRMTAPQKKIEEKLEYVLDSKGRLIEFNQNIIEDALLFNNILRFGYKATSDYHHIKQYPIHVFPNPATSHVTLLLPKHLSQSFQIFLFDCNGKKLMSIPSTEPIPIESLSPGAYFVQVIDQSGIYHTNFVKE